MILYALTVVSFCILLDISFANLDDSLRNHSSTDGGQASRNKKAYELCYMIEFSLLAVFLIEFLLHSAAFGILFNCKFNTITSWLLLLVNLSSLVSFAYHESLRASFFGSKLLASIIMLYLRLDSSLAKFGSKVGGKPTETTINESQKSQAS